WKEEGEPGQHAPHGPRRPYSEWAHGAAPVASEAGRRGRDPRLRDAGRRAGLQHRPRLGALRGLADRCAGTTINRFCGSGQQAVHFAAQAVMSGAMEVAVAGGIESMNRVPMGSDGVGPGEGPLSKRFMELYPDLVPQGLSAEMVAEK